MALSNLDPSDLFTIVETKIDATIDKVNEIDLNITGGTIGQVLSKSSSTDYDYDWISEQDVSGKFDSSKILTSYISAVGPTSYGAETTITTLIPSVTKSCTKMKYTFTGYLTNDVAVGTTIKLKRAGSEISRTITVCPASGQINFCLIWFDTYTANQSITITAQASDGGEVNYYSLICEALDAAI